MDHRWTPVTRVSEREARVILHKTASMGEVRDGTSTDGLDVSKLVSVVTHSQFQAEVTLSWNYSLFGAANQPKANQVLELQLRDNGVFQPIWIGVIESLQNYTMSRGQRSMQLIARSRDSLDIFRTTKRVTQLFPQLTDISYIIAKIGRNAGLNEDEIVIPPSGFTTSHTNTQLADMSAWEMFQALFLPLGWTPFIDSLGRLRHASRDLNTSPAVILEPWQVKSVVAQRNQAAVTRFKVKWLDPVLKKSKQQGRKLAELPLTVGWFLPFIKREIFFSEDRTQRAEDTKMIANPSANTLFVRFCREEYKQTGENKGELKITNLAFYPILATLAAWTIASQQPDIAPVGGGPTIPVGRRVQAAAQLTFMFILMSIGTGIYEFWGTPYDWIYARNTTEAFDVNAPNWIDKQQEVETDFIANELHAQAVAVRELIFLNKSSNKWAAEIADDPRIEYGDIVEFPDGSRMYIEDYRRVLTRGSEAILKLEGFLIGQPGAVSQVIDGPDADGDYSEFDPSAPIIQDGDGGIDEPELI